MVTLGTSTLRSIGVLLGRSLDVSLVKVQLKRASPSRLSKLPNSFLSSTVTMGQNEQEKPHISGQANSPMSAPAHALTFEQVAQELNGNINDGLTESEAKQRLETYGRNEFGEQEGVQPLKIFIGQIANALTLVSYLTQASSSILEEAHRQR